MSYFRHGLGKRNQPAEPIFFEEEIRRFDAGVLHRDKKTDRKLPQAGNRPRSRANSDHTMFGSIMDTYFSGGPDEYADDVDFEEISFSNIDDDDQLDDAGFSDNVPVLTKAQAAAVSRSGDTREPALMDHREVVQARRAKNRMERQLQRDLVGFSKRILVPPNSAGKKLSEHRAGATKPNKAAGISDEDRMLAQVLAATMRDEYIHKPATTQTLPSRGRRMGPSYRDGPLQTKAGGARVKPSRKKGFLLTEPNAWMFRDDGDFQREAGYRSP